MLPRRREDEISSIGYPLAATSRISLSPEKILNKLEKKPASAGEAMITRTTANSKIIEKTFPPFLKEGLYIAIFLCVAPRLNPEKSSALPSGFFANSVLIDVGLKMAYF